MKRHFKIKELYLMESRAGILMIHARRVLGIVFVGSIRLERCHNSWKSLWRDFTELVTQEKELLPDSALPIHIMC
jgi:hypothetical protein